MGAYDIVIVAEAPNDEVVAKFALAAGSLGNVRTTTLKAFTEAEFRKIVAALPRAQGIVSGTVKFLAVQAPRRLSMVLDRVPERVTDAFVDHSHGRRGRLCFRTLAPRG